MGISIWQLLIILAIVLVIFGAKRLKNVGTDLGSAIKGFKKAVSEDDEKKSEQQTAEAQKTLSEEKKTDNVYDAQVTEKQTDAEKPKV
ncbi:twin-arginine translocase TatA/TatE family subunit [Thiomicrospira microaerophila]|uniref:twin-arginine translocase TatA/TatE family subunit n=1 Tax=Thiomicrospira microaerophila TaxID=406020 RepID=UPI00200BDCD1|nr:twin-arginine translocase TatA/TatE family subunit [Thiomicrospira microaerophila]UQB42066.1 twin-arginine translocase TatA/TatE family subunit [Thiomicrospira microaerophila]